MQRLFGFAPNKSADEQVFLGNSGQGGSSDVQNRAWNKPRGCSMVYIFMVGAGGGGGSGRLGATATARFGGGGGGAGGVVSLLLPAWAVPDQLAVAAGATSPGGIPQTTADTSGLGAAIVGGRTILVYPTTNGGQIFADANAGVAGVGGTATSGTAGSGGGGVVNVYWLDQLAMSKVLTGSSGSSGASGAGAAVNQQSFNGGGAGGGGVSTGNVSAAGGTITNLNAIAGLSVFPRLINGGAAPGGTGGQGLNFRGGPFLQTGGAGGGGNAATAGGDGGHGGIGSGGGGGGGALNGTQSGRGGAGGPGMVIITAW